MNSRTLTLYRSMRQAIKVVDTHPELRAYADQSRAFALFSASVDEFAALQDEEAASRLELKELAARKKVLTDDVNLTIAGICATAALIPQGLAPLPPLSTVSPRLITFAFVMHASAVIQAAARYADVFVRYGLHPGTFDDAQAAIARLSELDRDELHTCLHARSFPTRLATTIATARKRRQVLYLQLKRVMTQESLAEWRHACALGRVHRTKLLSAPPSPKLLNAPRAVGDAAVEAAQSDPTTVFAEPAAKSAATATGSVAPAMHPAGDATAHQPTAEAAADTRLPSFARRVSLRFARRQDS